MTKEISFVMVDCGQTLQRTHQAEAGKAHLHVIMLTPSLKGRHTTSTRWSLMTNWLNSRMASAISSLTLPGSYTRPCTGQCLFLSLRNFSRKHQSADGTYSAGYTRFSSKKIRYTSVCHIDSTVDSDIYVVAICSALSQQMYNLSNCAFIGSSAFRGSHKQGVSAA